VAWLAWLDPMWRSSFLPSLFYWFAFISYYSHLDIREVEGKSSPIREAISIFSAFKTFPFNIKTLPNFLGSKHFPHLNRERATNIFSSVSSSRTSVDRSPSQDSIVVNLFLWVDSVIAFPRSLRHCFCRGLLVVPYPTVERKPQPAQTLTSCLLSERRSRRSLGLSINERSHLSAFVPKSLSS